MMTHPSQSKSSPPPIPADLPPRRIVILQRALLWLSIACCGLAAFPVGAAGQNPSRVDASFRPAVTVDGAVIRTLVIQPDGKILIGGASLTNVNGTPHASIARLNANGTVDTGFNAQTDAELDAIALQPDGKILIGGFFTKVNGVTRPTIARLNANGTLDTSFNAGSGVRTDAAFGFRVKAIAMQKDGKILIGGDFGSVNGATHNGLARLNSNGSLDTSFDPLLTGDTTSGAFSIVSAIIVQPDGRIVVGGYFSSISGTALHGIARLNSNGSVDPAFHASGVKIGNLEGVVFTLALQGDGKIIVGGDFATINGTQRKSNLARLNSNGTLDTPFNPDLGPFSAFSHAIAVQPDGKIVVGGAGFGVQSSDRSNGIARLNADGSLDKNFGALTNGDRISVNNVEAVGLQPDGKVVIGGNFSGVNNTVRPDVARLQASNGQLDASFLPRLEGVGGVGLVKVQSDGKIVVAGQFSSVNGSAHKFLARINPNGAVDNSFNAVIDTGVPDGLHARFAPDTIAVQSDNKVIYYGIGSLDNDPSFQAHHKLARLNTDGSVDSTFHATVDEFVDAILLQPDNKIVIVGMFSHVNGAAHSFVARLNPNGSVDTTFHSPQLDAATFNGTSAPIQVTAALQSNGKIVIGGVFAKVDGAAHFEIARLNADGTVDKSFNASLAPAPSSNITIPPHVDALVIQPDGKIVLGGFFQRVDGVTRQNLARVSADGSLDAGFNPEVGSGPTIFFTGFSIKAVFLQQNGRLLIGGAFTDAGGEPHNHIARFNADGTIDSSFTVTAGSNFNSFFSPLIETFALQPDGEIVLGGDFFSIDGVEHLGLARLAGDPVPSRLLNISTRLKVLQGDNVLIGGFIVTGTETKKVLIRALGPSLPVGAALADPVLELHDSMKTLATNDNWKVNDQTGQSQQAEIAATTIPPKSDLEAALIATLPANNSAYTAIVRGKNGGTGVGQVEVYDLGTTANSQLANISTRGFVDTGDNVMIGGVIAGPNSAGSTKVLLRAIGPSLGISGALADPTLELHNGNGTTIASNDNWKVDDKTGASQQAEIEATQAPPKSDLESALIDTVTPGNYTAIVRGKDNTRGIGLVEVYNLQ
jgi:uncharacterized delta-60 repeat protein